MRTPLLVVLLLSAAPLAHAQVSTVPLAWTAPGDDGNVGAASLYEIRFSTNAPDTTSQATTALWWSTAIVETGIPKPHIAGTAEADTVGYAFSVGKTYYFVLRTCDEAGNCSTYSNVCAVAIGAVDTVPPARVVDLRKP